LLLSNYVKYNQRTLLYLILLLKNVLGGYTLGLSNAFVTPGTLFILIGLFIVIMAATNRIDNKIASRIIGSDWGR
jgi:hypothetical protein